MELEVQSITSSKSSRKLSVKQSKKVADRLYGYQEKYSMNLQRKVEMVKRAEK